jgi:hypothetical protein
VNDRDEGFLICNVENTVLLTRDDYDADYSLDPPHRYSLSIYTSHCGISILSGSD